jgi:hypothetical protein
MGRSRCKSADSTCSRHFPGAAAGVDGDEDHAPFPGYQPDGPFASCLRLDGATAPITRGEVRDLTAPKIKR